MVSAVTPVWSDTKNTGLAVICPLPSTDPSHRVYLPECP